MSPVIFHDLGDILFFVWIVYSSSWNRYSIATPVLIPPPESSWCSILFSIFTGEDLTPILTRFCSVILGMCLNRFIFWNMALLLLYIGYPLTQKILLAINPFVAGAKDEIKKGMWLCETQSSMALWNCLAVSLIPICQG